MGSLFQFTCEGCGYRAEVSGGRDVGMIAVVRTMTCRGCNELVDVVIGGHGQDGPTGEVDLDASLGRCPSCKGNDVTPWGPSRPCPKCGERMKRGGLTVLWD